MNEEFGEFRLHVDMNLTSVIGLKELNENNLKEAISNVR